MTLPLAATKLARLPRSSPFARVLPVVTEPEHRAHFFCEDNNIDTKTKHLLKNL
jgi:hypothetical protein